MNRLAREKSPYLLQHARNPVDWYPWGPEAFERARAEDKFVFLSVGYAACHWCHVMERESFEDSGVATLLGEIAVAVKVDREERPDVDQVYMAACQAFSGRGGWPLTAFLTPDGVPFFVGTYFPRDSGHGRFGLMDLVRRIAELWRGDRDSLFEQGRQVLEHLSAQAPAGRSALDPAVSSRAARHFLQAFDPRHGGFGGAPKFPSPHQLTFLLRRWRRTGERSLLAVVEKTLESMSCGGLLDHLGGGFHRYSTDARWLLPHFEKMLYDQAGLALAYLEAYRITGAPRWAEVAQSIFQYVCRDLTTAEGAFGSAEDADSEGVEGKFYLWGRSEVLDVLGQAEGELFCRVYGVVEGGNVRDEATGEDLGANVLHLPRSVAAWAEDLGVGEEELSRRLSASRSRLLERRNRRVRPLLDDKVLTGWNGLMISALARGAVVLGEPRYADAAARAADFVTSALRPEGRLLRRYRQGEASVGAFAEDFAFLAAGLLDLYGATFDSSRLRQASDLAAELFERFEDPAGGGLFDAANDAEPLVLRPRQAYDGATPSANSVALEVSARLWLLTGNSVWETRARGITEAFGSEVNQSPPAFTHFLQGAALLEGPTGEVVVVGRREAPATRALLDAARKALPPEAALLLAAEGDAEVERMAPFTASMRPPGGAAAAAFVCEASACLAPITDPQELSRLLGAENSSRTRGNGAQRS